MPISYPISLPASPVQRSITIRPRSVVAMTESPFTLKQQVYAWAGQAWEGSVELPPMSRADGEAWVAALISLNGREGTFLLGDVANKTARGVATGPGPLVMGGGQAGYDLVTDGWTFNVTNILRAGDWVQLGSGANAKLYKVMADVNSNPSGQATLTLWPKLRSSPADNDPLTISSPKGLFRLSQEVEYNIDAARIYGIAFSFIEAL